MHKTNLGALTMCLLVLAQIALPQWRAPIIAGRPVGEVLHDLRVDTTNHARIREMADSADHPYNNLACLFLAQRGYRDMLPTLKARYDSLVRLEVGEPLDYLAGLYVLGDPQTYTLAEALIDTMVARENSRRHHYFGDEWADAVEFLLAYGDYSRYDLFASLFDREDKPEDFYIADFVQFARDNNLRPRVYQRLKDLLSSPRADYRMYAATLLSGFTDFADVRETIRNVAMYDPSDAVKLNAIRTLILEFSDPFALTALEATAKKTSDSASFVAAIYEMEDIPAPEALAALKGILEIRTSEPFCSEIALVVRTYRPPLPRSTQSVVMSLDSLVNYTPRVANFGWLADANFVNELDGNLQSAQTTLIAGDSLNCARQVKAFQQKIDEEYKDSLDNDNRTVTIEGWKFLYYNAQYILDRLPQIPAVQEHIHLPRRR